MYLSQIAMLEPGMGPGQHRWLRGTQHNPLSCGRSLPTETVAEVNCKGVPPSPHGIQPFDHIDEVNDKEGPRDLEEPFSSAR